MNALRKQNIGLSCVKSKGSCHACMQFKKVFAHVLVSFNSSCSTVALRGQKRMSRMQ